MLRIFLVLSILLLHYQGISQRARFRTWSIEQGLSQSVVNCVFQDSKGFLWVGTQNGLNRFNGHEFQVYLYNPEDSTSISNNWIYAIAEDREGNLWVGTKGGLNKFIGEKNIFQRFSYAPGYGRTISLCAYDVLAGKDGNLYINTPPALTVFEPSTGRFVYHTTKYFYDGSVYDNRQPLMEDRKGRIWVGTNAGLACFDTRTKKFDYPEPSSGVAGELSDHQITALCEDRAGTIWVGTARGLNLIRQEGGTHILPFPGDAGERVLGRSFIRAIVCDNKGSMWVGTEGGGLSSIKAQEGLAFLVDRYTAEVDGLGDNIVLSLTLDRSQNLWAGTLKGVSKTDLKSTRFRLYRKDGSSASVDLAGNVIAAIWKDPKGLLWIGNWGQGLNIYDRSAGRVTRFTSRSPGKNHIPDDFVHVIFPDESGNPWIGTRNGIAVFDRATGSFTSWNTFFRGWNLPNLSGIRIYSIIRGKEGSYWIGTQTGLYRILPDRKSYQLFTAESLAGSRIGANLIYDLQEDREGAIWIATINGLDVYNPARRTMHHFRKSETKNSLCDNFVISLCEDHLGNMWIGTGSYVNKFVRKDSAFLYYSKDQGIPNNNIFEIAEDGMKQLWFATGGGLCRFDERTGTFRNYDTEDGLQSLEFNLRSCYASPDGEMFFGGMNGFNSFYPSEMKDNPYIPEVAITSLFISGKQERRVMFNGSAPAVTLTRTEQAFTVEFVALEFTSPEKNQYAYMLEGVSDDWIPIGNRRFVPFSNLPPGDYLFRVKASNNDGVWNESGATLRITILPPWWRSGWAVTGYIALVLFTIVIIIRLRERNLIRERTILEAKVHERTLQIEEQNKELQSLNSELKALNSTKDKFFSIIAHDLRNPFNSILGLTEIMLASESLDPQRTRKYLTNIRDSSRHAFDLLQNLLIWARAQTGSVEFKPCSLDLTERIEENIMLVQGQATKKNIAVVAENDQPIPMFGDIGMINTILRNLLTNAIKFTPREGRVSVTAEKTEGMVSFSVSDNGVGMTPEIMEKLFRPDSKYSHKGTDAEQGTGLGLILCREFAEKHGGTITVTSESGKGSCFTVRVPDVS